jgi:hypothetical protein
VPRRHLHQLIALFHTEPLYTRYHRIIPSTSYMILSILFDDVCDCRLDYQVLKNRHILARFSRDPPRPRDFRWVPCYDHNFLTLSGECPLSPTETSFHQMRFSVVKAVLGCEDGGGGPCAERNRPQTMLVAGCTFDFYPCPAITIVGWRG